MILPPRLAPRTRVLNDRAFGAGAVVYWMRTAVRAHENAALDVAIMLSREHDVPLLVYHALSERTPFASDRHHRFILEGARDVARQFQALGIHHAFHLERPGHRGPHLHTLAQTATAIVTEEMPVDPLRRWTRALADSAPCPVLAVDTATVVPMRLVGPGIERAYAYRKRIQPHLDEALLPWDPVEPRIGALADLPFEPVDLAHADLGALIAACSIDHTVPPVNHSVGGSAAGYARWEAFKHAGLERYAADRNDVVLQGTSRLSAYLHYGMVAPTRLAREAEEAGASKYFDELVVWRELAYTWCLYERHHDTLDALPAWARQSLLAHVHDPRELLPGLERLHLGQTGDPLWDLAQRSLLHHGELHNNVRMTWGKAIHPWSPDPQTALTRMVDLNHRYALDGRDPASYGGLLWCLGRFDRPFPESLVWGTVRGRSSKAHAQRVDLPRWAAQLAPKRRLRVGIVGAGLTGSFAGHLLQAHGFEVTLVDKGRGAGGRLSARRASHGRWVHGAPVLHITDPRLDRYVEGWIEAGLANREGDGTLRIDPPNQLVKHLQRDLDVHFGEPITRIARDGRAWTLHTATRSFGPFDALLVTAPAPQSLALLGDRFPALMQVRYRPCWVGLARFDSDPGGCTRPDSIERVLGEGLLRTFHADATTSTHHLEAEPTAMAAWFLAQLDQASWPRPAELAVHRWRYARLAEGLPEDALYDPEARIGVAGDLFAGGDANGALLSGAAAFARIVSTARDREG